MNISHVKSALLSHNLWHSVDSPRSWLANSPNRFRCCNMSCPSVILRAHKHCMRTILPLVPIPWWTSLSATHAFRALVASWICSSWESLILRVIIVKAWSSFVTELVVSSTIADRRSFSFRIRIILNLQALSLLCPVAIEPSNFSIDCIREVVLERVLRLAPVPSLVPAPVSSVDMFRLDCVVGRAGLVLVVLLVKGSGLVMLRSPGS